MQSVFRDLIVKHGSQNIIHESVCEVLHAANKRHGFIASLMLGQRRRRWASIKLALVDLPIFTWYIVKYTTNIGQVQLAKLM